MPVYQNDQGLYITRTATTASPYAPPEHGTGTRRRRAVRGMRAARWRSSAGQQPGSLKLAMRVCQPLPAGAAAA